MEIRRYFLFCLSSLTSTVPLKSFGNKSFIHLFHSDGVCSCFPGFILFYLVRFQCTMCDGPRLQLLFHSIKKIKKNLRKGSLNFLHQLRLIGIVTIFAYDVWWFSLTLNFTFDKFQKKVKRKIYLFFFFNLC